MKKLNFLGVLMITLCFVHSSYAQDVTPLTCDEKVNIAKAYVPYLKFLTPELKAEILLDIKDCIESGLPDAQYISAMITLDGDFSQSDEQQALNTIEIAANEGVSEAQRTLGLFYKNGSTLNTDLDKSFEWFEKAANQGDEFAKYALGYFTLKGLGNVQQDYLSAVQKFKSSVDPMAKHWEAICYYYGYGVPKNKDLALQILKENNIENSVLLALQIQEPLENPNEPSPTDFSITADEIKVLNRQNEDSEVLTTDEVSFVYQGKFIEYDWSKTSFKRTFPFDFSLEYNNDTNTLDYNFKLDNVSHKGTANYEENKVVFNKKIILRVKRHLRDHPEVDSITYEISSLKFDLVKPVSGTDPTYVIGDIDGYIPEWKEPMMPSKFLLKQFHKPGETPIPPAGELIDLVVSPNPTNGVTRAIFTLNIPMVVNLEVRSTSGATVFKSDRYSFPAGRHSIEILVPFVSSGSYYMSLYAGNKRYSETILKN